MNFDIAIQNPPFLYGYSLKFLDKLTQISHKTISIQPIGWLINPIGKYMKTSKINKYKDTILIHLTDLDILDITNVKFDFNIVGLTDLGIFVLDNDNNYDIHKKYYCDELVDSVLDFTKDHPWPVEHLKKDGYRLRVVLLTFGKSGGSGRRKPILPCLPMKDIVFKDGMKDGKMWHEYYQKNQYTIKSDVMANSVRFENEEEAHNFYASMQCDFIKWFIAKTYASKRIDKMSIVWVGDIEHPRTHRIGYKDVWMDEDYYKLLNISEDNQKKIKRFMDDYREKVKNFENEK